jgi:hypothetical protein
MKLETYTTHKTLFQFPCNNGSKTINVPTTISIECLSEHPTTVLLSNFVLKAPLTLQLSAVNPRSKVMFKNFVKNYVSSRTPLSGSVLAISVSNFLSIVIRDCYAVLASSEVEATLVTVSNLTGSYTSLIVQNSTFHGRGTTFYSTGFNVLAINNINVVGGLRTTGAGVVGIHASYFRTANPFPTPSTFAVDVEPSSFQVTSVNISSSYFGVLQSPDDTTPFLRLPACSTNNVTFATLADLQGNTLAFTNLPPEYITEVSC